MRPLIFKTALVHILPLLAGIFLLAACGPSLEEINKSIDEKVRATVEALPTALPTSTPVSIPTPLATPTPVTFPTPLPTPTRVTFPTPLPTPTPVTFPTPLPTPTPIALNASGLPALGAAATPTPFRWEGYWPAVRVSTSTGFGNGVLISSTEVLTANHVIGSGSNITVTLPRSAGQAQESRSATIRGYSASDDLALLTISPFSARDIDFAVPIASDSAQCTKAKSAVEDGDDIVVETTGNERNSVRIYRLWGKRSVGVTAKLFKSDIAVASGISGSPVYSTTGRTLVGIVVQGDTGLSSMLSMVAVDGCVVSNRLPDLKAGNKG